MFCCRISVFNCPSYLFITGTEVTPVKSWSTSSLSALHPAVEKPADRFFKAFSMIGPLHALKLCAYDYSAFEGRGVLISAPSLLICPSMHLFTLALDECWKFRTHPYLVVTPCWPSLHCVRGAYRWWPHSTNCGYFRSLPIHSQKSLSLLSIQDQWERGKYILNCPAEVWSQAGLCFANLYPLYEKCERSLGGSMARTAHRAPR